MRFFLKAGVFFLWFLWGVIATGQTFTAFEKAGDEAYKQADYYAAMHYYSKALAKNDEDVYVCYQYAMVAKAFSAFEIAEKYLKKTLKLDKERVFGEALYHLASVYKQTGNYDLAIEYFNRFKTENTDSQLLLTLSREIAACEKAKSMLEHPALFDIIHFGKGVNTAYSEFGALKRGDTLYYTSYRFDNKNDKNKPVRKISKALISVRGSRGRVIRRFNADGANTAHVTFSLDGKRIYYNICTYGKGLDIKCVIYYKEKDKRGRWKKTAAALPDTINLKGYTATQPAIGFDSLKKKELLFFVSDRPGGKGGLDIWKVTVDKGKNKFGPPEPVEAVNSSGNEISPFFDNKTQKLFFSSDRPESMGGFDVFFWLISDKIRKTKQLYPPINSSYNDIYYTLNTDGETGYFSSNRPGSFYLDKSNKACCNDIYAFKPKPPEPSIDSFEVADNPVIIKKTEEPLMVEEPETLEDFLPLALYFDNDEPDKRTRRTTTRKNYDQTFQKYKRKKELFKSNFAAPLEEEKKAEANYLVESFFEREVEQGHRFLMLFSEILLQRLQNDEQVEIFIKGFTSPRARGDYNLSLGKRRVSCLKNHFFAYKNGIFNSFIDSGRLIITERSFGETSSAAGVSDALEDLRNSIYSPAASRERRVEIVEIKVGEE